jgi:hypothetical protein
MRWGRWLTTSRYHRLWYRQSRGQRSSCCRRPLQPKMQETVAVIAAQVPPMLHPAPKRRERKETPAQDAGDSIPRPSAKRDALAAAGLDACANIASAAFSEASVHGAAGYPRGSNVRDGCSGVPERVTRIGVWHGWFRLSRVRHSHVDVSNNKESRGH